MPNKIKIELIKNDICHKTNLFEWGSVIIVRS